MFNPIFFLLAFLVIGCSVKSVTMSDFNMDKVQFDTRDNKTQFQSYIEKNYIELGMTRNQVLESWGEPKKRKIVKYHDSDEMWIYIPNWKFRNKLFFKMGVLVKTEPDYLVVSKMSGHGVVP